MSVYARDILSRLPQLLATCTAIFGSVLKINSTKKVCKKLQGMAAGSASWCTNMGNERGEVLISVLTESEGLEGLCPMATGLIERYQLQHVAYYCLSYCVTQIPEGKAGYPTADVHRKRLLLCQWAVKVCSAVHEMGSPAISKK